MTRYPDGSEKKAAQHSANRKRKDGRSAVKKILCICLTLAALFALAACGAGDGSAASATETAPQTEKASPADYKAAFAEVVDSFEQKYGEWVSKKKESSVNGYGTGVLFCDLFDWDRDGSPELFVGYNTENKDRLLLSDLEVFTYKDGNARRILHGKPGRAYGETGSYQDFGFVLEADGTIMLCLSHTENGWDTEAITQYRYIDGKVTSVELTAQAEDYDKDSDEPPELNVFRIDGEKVSEAQYEKAKPKEDDMLYIVCNHIDYTALKAFLAGDADSCRSAFLTNKALHTDDPNGSESGSDNVPAWITVLASKY